MNHLRVVAVFLTFTILCGVCQLQAAPVNDDFANRITLSGTTVTTTGTNVEGSRESGEPNHNGRTSGRSVWWTWTAPSDGTAVIDTVGSSFNTVLGVYTGNSVANLTEIALNINAVDQQSLVTIDTIAGTEYQIVVEGTRNRSGNITLNIDASSAGVTIIAPGSDWAYLDDGSDQGTSWREVGFDDSGWATGPAQLGYGDSDEATVVGFGPDPNNKYITTYFRHTFTAAGPEDFTALNLRVIRDDGVVVYLNDTEIFRDNMPAGPVTSTTTALSAVAADTESTFFTATVNPNLLNDGLNVIAVEMHQNNGTSSDISFDLGLASTTDPINNDPPTVTISSPVNGTIFTEPANISISAVATDPDGIVSLVEFFEGNNKIGEATGPFSIIWNGVGIGSYTLTAVATDNLGASTTSSSVQIDVTPSSPPTIAGIVPVPGAVNSLNSITVTFSEPVTGVDASDLLLNGASALSVEGSGATYIFTPPLQPDGIVNITWAVNNGITDLESTPKPFDSTAPGATWQYTLTDVIAPTMTERTPAPGATVSTLPSVSVMFSEPVQGISASDLTMDGVAATAISGSGAGPYEFSFANSPTGEVEVRWIAGHGITDLATSPNAFAGGSWNYTIDPNATDAGVVINEIMYNPTSLRIEDEWIELHNTGSTTVNLTGWRLNRGIDLIFPNVSIAAGGYLVVAADGTAFSNKYPGIGNVVEGWTGRLSNSRDDIELENAAGDRIDRVEYADGGDWAQRRRGPNDGGHQGWIWYAEHDGLGASLELINPELSNNKGQNWGSSSVTDGTPGAPNSIADSDIAPLIDNPQHFPVIPNSTDQVTITASIIDEQTNGINVTLYHRDHSTTSPGGFSTETMHDDGLHNDGAANDGIYGFVLPSRADGTVTEFYIEASDEANNTRTWPNSVNQQANAVFMVDESTYTGNQPVYRLIMTGTERNELININRSSDAQMTGTFITREGTVTHLRYNMGARIRGAGSRSRTPPNYRVNVPPDTPWNGVESLNLNTQFTHAQLVGSAVALKAGLAAAEARVVQVRVNAQNFANSGSPQFGSYVHVEPINGDFASNHFPNDGNGNVYRASTGSHSARLEYLGTNPANYINAGYAKTSNNAENDWTDLIDLTFALDPSTTPDNAYVAAVRQNVNVEMWMRYFAVLSLMDFSETALGSGRGDDYAMYRPLIDPRFMVVPHDFDTVFDEGDTSGNVNESIYVAGALPIVNRFLRHPEFEPLYHAELHRLLNGTFATNSLFPMFDQLMGDWVPSARIENMKSFVIGRNASVRNQLPPDNRPPIATISGEPVSPTFSRSAQLIVGGSGITHYQYSLNGAVFSSERTISTPINLSGLSDGDYTVSVIGRRIDSPYQAEGDATISQTWTVSGGLAGVVISEVLARNDSAFSHEGTFPDAIELFNAGSAVADLSGMGLTDSLGSPHKYVFPNGTSLNPGSYLVVLANDPDGTSGLHSGFTINQNGDDVHLFNSIANGGSLVDSVRFGIQITDSSISFLNGRWNLSPATMGGANTFTALAPPGGLKINEWLTSSAQSDDFVELYNSSVSPVALGGLFLTDNPIGDPTRHRMPPLSFIASRTYLALKADGNTGNGADHLSFSLSSEQGRISLLTPDLTEIDCVIYAAQTTDVSQGRSPNGGTSIISFPTPTPGAANPTILGPLPPIRISLVPINQVWRYEDLGADLGSAWIDSNYDDSEWPSGPGLLGEESSSLPEPIRTDVPAPASGGAVTTYFRTEFNMPDDLDAATFEINHIIDDSAIIYLNGDEIARFNLPPGPIAFDDFSPTSIGNATWNGPINVSPTAFVAGRNVIAVENHQSSGSSSDIVMGLTLDAVIATNTPTAAGVVINEVLANNATLIGPEDNTPDWIEIHNPSDSAVDLFDMSLSDDTTDSRKWVFPSGSIIPAEGYLTIYFDADSPASNNNTGFGLKVTGDAVYLFDRSFTGGALLDSIQFGLQAPDLSISRIPDGSDTWSLSLPTENSSNLPAATANSSSLLINEWMADPNSGDDWFEIFNPNAQPVAMGGLHLTDTLINPLKHRIPSLSFIGSGSAGYQRFRADDNPQNGADHVNFKLAASGESIGLFTTTGTVIDSVSFGPQLSGASEGRLPDGDANIVTFTETDSPGEANFLPIASVVISEALTHTDLPFEDAIELHNISGSPVDIGGWFLSDQRSLLEKFRIPNGTILPPDGYDVFYEFEFNPNPNDADAFALSSSKGDQIYLTQTADGAQTGYRSSVKFGAAESAITFGRFITSVGKNAFVSMSAITLGVNNPETVAEFRQGTGGANAYPQVGPVIVSEIMYHPVDINGTNDNVLDEYIELRNISASSVDLFDPAFPTNGWRLRDAVDFDFAQGTSIGAGERLLVVSFDPVADPVQLSAFRSETGFTTTPVVGPYSGKLDNSKDSVELYKPDTPQPLDGANPGFVPYVLQEKVVYEDDFPWPTAPDGNGPALRRSEPTLFGDDPSHWISSVVSDGDEDNDGMDDDWERLYGLDPTDPTDANLDLDNDGATSIEEFQAGTDPTDPSSVLSLRIVGRDPVTLEFDVIANATYVIEYRDSVSSGVWQVLTTIAPQPAPQTLQRQDASGENTRFYRLVKP